DGHLAGGCGQGPTASFVDAAPLVDEEVVADVAPAAGDRVVVVDAAHDARALGLGVAVRARGLVDAGGTQLDVLRLPPHEGLVGAPPGAADDRGPRDGGRRYRGRPGALGGGGRGPCLLQRGGRGRLRRGRHRVPGRRDRGGRGVGGDH